MYRRQASTQAPQQAQSAFQRAPANNQQGRPEMARYSGPDARPAGDPGGGGAQNIRAMLTQQPAPNQQAMAHANPNARFQQPGQPPAPQQGMPPAPRPVTQPIQQPTQPAPMPVQPPQPIAQPAPRPGGGIEAIRRGFMDRVRQPIAAPAPAIRRR